MMSTPLMVPLTMAFVTSNKPLGCCGSSRRCQGPKSGLVMEPSRNLSTSTFMSCSSGSARKASSVAGMVRTSPVGSVIRNSEESGR